MNVYRRIAWIFLCLIEFFCIIFLLVHYVKKKQAMVLGIEQNAPLYSDTIQVSSDSAYTYYYELPAGELAHASINFLPKEVVYSYNSDGFHSKRDYAVTKPIDVYRVMTLGDSFTFGFWVNTAENFSSKLENMFHDQFICTYPREVEVINGGVPSFDVRYASKRYTDKGAKYIPDLVIWFIRDENIYFSTDAYRKLEEFYKKELQASGAATRYHVDQADPFAASHLAYLSYMDTYIHKNADDQAASFAPEMEALRLWRATYPSIQLLLLTTKESEERYKQLLLEFSRTHPSTSYVEVGDIETFAPHDYHPNMAGHERIAEELYRFLIVNSMIPCGK